MMTNGFQYFVLSASSIVFPVCYLLPQTKQIMLSFQKARLCFSISKLKKNHREILYEYAQTKNTNTGLPTCFSPCEILSCESTPDGLICILFYIYFSLYPHLSRLPFFLPIIFFLIHRRCLHSL